MAPVDFAARADGPDGLPTGEPIEREAIAWFRRQQKKVLGIIAPDMAELPDHFPHLADYDDPMSRAMTPIIAAYWQEAGASTTAGLAAKTGLDLNEWKVTNPHLRAMIEQSALKFCKSTNETTSKDLNAALADLRKSLVEGIVEKGEAPRQLAARVKEIFEGCETWKAHSIAVTEASRAVHAAQYVAAEQSGVVAGFEWLLSSDACPICRAQAARCPRVPMGRAFATIGDNPDYSTVRYPPLHPNDQCTVTEILLPAYGGPEHPEWGETVHFGPKGATTQQEPEPAVEPKPAPTITPGPHPLPKPGEPITHPDDPTFSFDASARSRREKDRMVWADVATLDEAWSKDESFYIGPGGTGQNPQKGKYEAAVKFIAKARAEGVPIEMSEVHVDEAGKVTFLDGRHRFAVLRDEGLTRLPIAVSKDAAKRAAKLYGINESPPT